MATVLPTYQADAALPTPQGPMASGFGAPAEALRQLGGQVEQTANAAGYLVIRRKRELEEIDANDYTATTTANLTDKHYQRFLNDSENAPPGAKGFTEAFMQGYDADMAEAVKNAPNDLARRQVQERLLSLRGTLHSNSLVFERDAGKQNRQENVAASVSKLSNIAIGSPELYGDLKGQVEDTVNAYRGDMTAGEFVKVRDTAQNTLAQAALEGSIQKDPHGTIRVLNSGQFDTLLKPDEKNRLLGQADAEINRQQSEADTAIRLQWAKEDHAYTQQQRAERQQYDATQKSGDQLLATKQLTPDWIEHHRDSLSPDDYRYFYRQLTSDAPARTEPGIFTDLWSRKANGDNITDDARFAYTHGQIRQEDYEKLSPLKEPAQPEPAWYKAAQASIKARTGYSELNPQPDTGVAYTNALGDFEEWKNANPDATYKEALAQSFQIADHYRLVATQQTRLTIKAPRTLVGTLAQPDIDATEAEFAKRLEAGQLDPSAAADEALRIQALRKLIEAEQQGQPAGKQ